MNTPTETSRAEARESIPWPAGQSGKKDNGSLPRLDPRSRPWAIGRLLGLLTAASLLAAILTPVLAGPAGAVIGDDYPHADATEHDASNYEWWIDEDGDGEKSVTPAQTDNDESVSARGYYYRNCTDYVAWKLEALGVGADDVRGNGNGGQWDDNNSTKVTSVPLPGMAAVSDAAAGGFGHVAFVEDVHSNGTVTISEYNWNGDGTFGTRTGSPADLGIDDFIDFGASYGTPTPDSSFSESSLDAGDDDLMLVRFDGQKFDFFVEWDLATGHEADFQNWGLAGDRFLVGQFGGDSADDVVLVRENSATGKLDFYFDTDQVAGHEFSILGWGNVGDDVMVGDFDGSGDDDLMLVRFDGQKFDFFIDTDQVRGHEEEFHNWGVAGDDFLVGDFGVV